MLILGLFTRVASTVVALQFAVILLFVKLKGGLSGLEFDLLIFASAVLLSNFGCGRFGVDELIGSRGKTKNSVHEGTQAQPDAPRK